MKPDQDWMSVWPAQRTFHPASVPLPVRQGFAHLKGQVDYYVHFNLEWSQFKPGVNFTAKQCERLQILEKELRKLENSNLR